MKRKKKKTTRCERCICSQCMKNIAGNCNPCGPNCKNFRDICNEFSHN